MLKEAGRCQGGLAIVPIQRPHSNDTQQRMSSVSELRTWICRKCSQEPTGGIIAQRKNLAWHADPPLLCRRLGQHPDGTQQITSNSKGLATGFVWLDSLEGASLASR